MATVTYNFEPNDAVWYLTETCGLKKAKIVRIDIAVIPFVTTIYYEVELDEDRSRVKEVLESTLYADADIATAIADYQTQLTT